MKVLKYVVSFFILMFSFSSHAQSTNEKHLKNVDWLLGKRQGSGDGIIFYEDYVLKNDTLIEIRYFDKDSSFTNLKNTGFVYLSEGFIVHKYGTSLWKCSYEDYDKLSFKPYKNVSNSFIWKKGNKDYWNVYMGHKKYVMRRYKVKGPN